jgi:hypothetical protein
VSAPAVHLNAELYGSLGSNVLCTLAFLSIGKLTDYQVADLCARDLRKCEGLGEGQHWAT